MKRATCRTVEQDRIGANHPPRWMLLALTIAGALILLGLVLTEQVGAAALSGNKGGCARGNQVYGLACTVNDAGAGWVMGACEFGFWFGPVRTARAFSAGQAVTVSGCEGENAVLYSAPGFPLRISR